MKVALASALLLSTAFAAPATAATQFVFNEADSFVTIVSNDTTCVFGSCSLSASLLTPFDSFSLEVGESQTFDFARFLVSGGFGGGSATIDAQLAFTLPSADPAGAGGTASYLRLGGIFTPGALAGSLIWNTPSQQLTASDGTKFTVTFGNLVGAQFGQSAVAPVTVRLDSVVPEPASWALMITGFGLVGAASRRRVPANVRFA